VPKVLRVSMRYLGMGYKGDIPVVFVHRDHRVGVFRNSSYGARDQLRNACANVPGKVVESTETDWAWVSKEL